MAIDPSVKIDIAAEFTGKKAFDKADTSTQKLTKSVKTLAKGFLGVFAIQKLVSYSKASVKAFAADDAAAKSLGQTLKNLGLAYGSNIGTVNGFINRLEAQTGVLDDELRPAMDRLLRATGDVTKSQELLGLALDIAAGTGKSVTQVSQSLQKAYLGQTAALGRLGVGLSKAELASGSFEEIQSKLNDLFAGQAVSAANSYQGSLNKLTVAANNAKETIGKGLVNAIGVLSGSSTVDPAVSGIDRIANSIANATVETAKFIKVTKTLLSDLSFFKNEATAAEALRIKLGTGFTTPMTISSQDTQRADKIAADKAKRLADAKIKADKLATANKIKADKLAAANKLKLDKAAAVFDLNKIQIAAALKGKISEEEKTRLLLMQAIANEDANKAEMLQKKLEDIQAKNAKIAADLLAIGQAKDPFSTWSSSLAAALIELNKVGERMFAIRQRESGFVDTSILGGNTGGNTGGGNTFPKDATPDQIVAIVEEAVQIAQEAADTAAASVEATQKNTDALAAAADAALTLATETSVATDIATQAQTSSIYNPYGGMTEDASLAAQASALLAAGSNAGAGTSSSMFNPYARTDGGPGFGTAINYNYVTVEVAGSVLTENDFDEVINKALLNNIRRGYTQSPAGSLP